MQPEENNKQISLGGRMFLLQIIQAFPALWKSVQSVMWLQSKCFMMCMWNWIISHDVEWNVPELCRYYLFTYSFVCSSVQPRAQFNTALTQCIFPPKAHPPVPFPVLMISSSENVVTQLLVGKTLKVWDLNIWSGMDNHLSDAKGFGPTPNPSSSQLRHF